MRIAKVMGKLTLSPIHESLIGGRFLICEVQDRFALQGQKRKSIETVVVYDHITGAQEGDLIAFGESREACMPFYPEKRVPLDAYCACLLDNVVINGGL